MLIYYVYAYLREDGTPYYIGKGKNYRAFVKGKGEVIPPKDKSRIVFLETNLSEIGALALERRMIRWYGRKDIGTGILRNMTDGGEGGSGGVRSEESRRKLSDAQKGKKHSEEIKKKWSEIKKGNKNAMFGKTHSEETIMKIKTNRKERTPFKGKLHSEEAKRKMSETRKLKWKLKRI